MTRGGEVRPGARNLAREVLIAEDDARLARLLARQLDYSGYAVRGVGDGQAVFTELKRARPSLLLLDLLLPKLQGQRVLERLRTTPEFADLPVIITSGVLRMHTDGAREARRHAQGYLEKPFTADALLAMIKGLIGPGGGTGAEQSFDLAVHSVAELFWAATDDEFTGVLHFQCSGRHKMLLFEGGDLRAVRSNLVAECLGNRLFDAGLVSASALADSSRRAKLGEELEGQTLIEQEAIDERLLKTALDDQAEAKLMQLFEWTTGRVWRQENVLALPLSTPFPRRDAEELVAAGVRKMDPEQLLQHLTPELDAEIVAHLPSGAVSAHGGPMLRLFAALKPGLLVRQLPVEQRPELFAAWKTGRLELRRRSRAPLAAKAAVAPTARAKSVQLEADLSQRVQRMIQQDLFSALNLTPAADTGQVLAAHARLSEQWSDACFADQPRRVRELASRLRARLDVALEVLGDDGRRAAYCEKLASRLRSDERDDLTLTSMACAEADYARASQFVSEASFAEAAQLLEALIESDGSEGDYRALYGWASFAAQPGDPQAQSLALDQLRKAIDLDPGSPLGPYYLGRIYRQTGQPNVARKFFRMALERSPGYSAAEQELRRLAAQSG